MVDRLPAANRGALVPYLIGAFLLTPFVLWGTLWLFAFPGPKYGFDRDVGIALFAVSVPLVMWFFLCCLGLIANSVAGVDEFKRPQAPVVYQVIGALPASAVLVGIGGTAFLVADAHPWPIALTPLAMSVLIAAAIGLGERARASDRGGSAATRERAEPAPAGLQAAAADRMLATAAEPTAALARAGVPVAGADEVRAQAAEPTGATARATSSAGAVGGPSLTQRLSTWGLMTVATVLLVSLVWGADVALIAVGLLGTAGFFTIFLAATLGRGSD